MFFLLIMKDGNIKEWNGDLSCSKNDMEVLAKLVKKTRGKWLPMTIDENPVNTFYRIQF